MSNNQIDNTKIIYNKDEPNADLRLQGQWVNDTTPLSAANLNAMLDAIKTNTVEIPKLENDIDKINTAGTKTKKALSIKYNINVNGVVTEQQVSFNGEAPVDVDLTHLASGGDVSVSASSNTGFTFINNELNWDTSTEDILGLTLVLDGGEYSTWFEETPLAEVFTVRESVSSSSISANINTGLEFVNNNLQWSSDELIPGLVLIMDGGTFADL